MLAGEVPAELGRNLILEVNPRGPGAGDGMHGGRGITPAGVNVHEQGQVHAADDAVDVRQDVHEVGLTDIRQTVGVVGDAGAGKIEGAESRPLGEQTGVGVDHAGDLQGFFRLECVTEI